MLSPVLMTEAKFVHARELAAVVGWWVANGRDLRWRDTRDPYAVWVAEVMSTQTQVQRAAEAWGRWIARWPTVEALAAAPLADVLSEWQGLGYPRRARDLHRGAQLIAAGGWPDDLRTLPGVGPYVAAAVRCFAFEEPELPLDVNVRRVLRRRFGGTVEIGADPWRAGQALMEFGQRICTARRPRCDECPVADGCAGPGEEPPGGRRQARFEGSDRQRRGRLLRRVLAEGAVAIPRGEEAIAASLAADGLAELRGSVLHPPHG